MKTSSVIRFLSSALFCVCCMASLSLLQSCGDDNDNDRGNVIDLPAGLDKQWIMEGDGIETTSVVYDLSHKGRFHVLWQPTAEYAARAEMNSAYYYLYNPAGIVDVDIDTKTGIIYVNTTTMGTIKVSNLTDESAMFDGRQFHVAKTKIKYVGEWRYINDPILQ